uniref:RNA pseudourine synthase 2, chloroplastic n=1 Tax=Aegilops tauschii TaxID=37682 RepID=N1R4Q2_AEGTA
MPFVVNICRLLVSHTVKGGDKVSCTVSELQPLRAEAEDIPLDIVYEDEHLLVVNKPAHMVVHPAPGNANGTLVNAILHHCKISTFTCLARSPIYDECPESSDDDVDVFDVDQFTIGEVSSEVREAIVRPGIVHRLDKGTSGLLVVAKDEHSHAQLAEQFKLHTISRVYISLTCGVPSPNSARIEVPISRDPNNRTRMVAAPGSGHRYAKHAASRYKVREVFCGGGSALVEWRLETGRTHQIRAHAKYLGNPLLGDETYGDSSILIQERHLNSHVPLQMILLRSSAPSRFGATEEDDKLLYKIVILLRNNHTPATSCFSSWECSINVDLDAVTRQGEQVINQSRDPARSFGSQSSLSFLNDKIYPYVDPLKVSICIASLTMFRA